MSTRWVADRESAIFTIVRKIVMDKWKTTYPDLYFTREEDNDELETNLYPSVYIRFVEREVGQTLDYGVNACQMKAIVDVTVSESMGLEGCKDIIYSVTDVLCDRFGFGMQDFPNIITMDSSVKRMVANTKYRTMGYNDVIK